MREDLVRKQANACFDQSAELELMQEGGIARVGECRGAIDGECCSYSSILLS